MLESMSDYKTLSTNYLLQTPWRAFRLDEVEAPDGRVYKYSYAETPSSIFVVPLTTTGNVVLLNHYRYPIRKWTTEIVAGARDSHETDPAETVCRELREEIGGTCRKVIHLTGCHDNTGHLDFWGDFFLAVGVELDDSQRVEEERSFIKPFLVPAQEAVKMARQGQINDVLSAFALLLAEPYILQELTELSGEL